MTSIVLPKITLKEKEGVVVIPLEKWHEIEKKLEDLEMYSSEGFMKEIKKRRKEKKTVSLKELLKKYRI